MTRWAVPPDLTFEGLADEWLSDLVGQVHERTRGLYRLHMLSHFEPHFGVPSAITTERIADYGRARLKRVKRPTLQKERSTLRGLLSWCHERGWLPEPPDVPPLPRRARGTAYEVRRRGKATELSPEECGRLIDALPEWSKARRDRPAFAVRSRFRVAHETSLRPATLDALSVPEHYSPGATYLLIDDELDKARFGRRLPLTQAARDALDSAIRGPGLIFGRHDYRWQLDRAAEAAQIDARKAQTLCPYDFRHARLTELAETGNLPGVAYLAGHRRITTTAIYVRPGLSAARRVVDAMEGDPITKVDRVMGKPHLLDSAHDCAKERTRTSTGVTPLAPQGSGGSSSNHLSATALRILEAAERRDVSLTHGELHDFARQALASTELGRLALGVLEGGAFSPLRAIELARLIVAQAPAVLELGEGSGDR